MTMSKTKDDEQFAAEIEALKAYKAEADERLKFLKAQLTPEQRKAVSKKSKAKTLTDLKVHRAKPGAWTPDPYHRGLRFYIGEGGVGTWCYRYRSLIRMDAQGNPMLDSVRLGNYPTMSLTEARSEWQKLKLLRKSGVDPKRSTTRKAVCTSKELVDDYINGYAKKIKRRWHNDYRILYKDVVPRFGEKPATLSRDEAKALLAEVAERGDQAAMQLLAVCRKAWNFAIEEGHITDNPFRQLKVVKGVVMASGTKVKWAKKKQAYWDDLSLQKFFRWLPDSGFHIHVQRIARLQLLTGVRPGEACGMAWEEIDWERETWTVPPEKHKAEKEHVVMLSQQAVELLQEQREESGGEFVFPAFQDMGQACRMNWFSHQWKRYVEKSTVDYITPHALRHTVITGMAELRCPLEISTRIAGHAEGQY